MGVCLQGKEKSLDEKQYLMNEICSSRYSIVLLLYLLCEWVGAKPRLWTLDWTMDWTMD